MTALLRHKFLQGVDQISSEEGNLLLGQRGLHPRLNSDKLKGKLASSKLRDTDGKRQSAGDLLSLNSLASIDNSKNNHLKDDKNGSKDSIALFKQKGSFDRESFEDDIFNGKSPVKGGRNKAFTVDPSIAWRNQKSLEDDEDNKPKSKGENTLKSLGSVKEKGSEDVETIQK